MASLTCDYCGKDLHKSKEIFWQTVTRCIAHKYVCNTVK